MEKIASFTVDHTCLKPGIYISREDYVNNGLITTFDLRMTAPNVEPVMNTAEIHAIEHIMATFLRNHTEHASNIIYFGPMGCRTGFYLIYAGQYENKSIKDLIVEAFTFVAEFEGDIPGASAVECGNYQDLNLDMAKYLAKRYLDRDLINVKSFIYEEN